MKRLAFRLGLGIVGVGLIGILGCASSAGNVIAGGFLRDNADDEFTREVGKAMVTYGTMKHEEEVAAAGADNTNVNVSVNWDGTYVVGGSLPPAQFNRVNLEPDVIEEGELGMRIYANLTVNQSHSPILVGAYFHYRDGDRLKDSDGLFRASNGQVVTSSDVFNPDHENEVFIFMPYKQFDIRKDGKHRLEFGLRAWEMIPGNPKELAKTQQIGFDYIHR